MGLFLSYILSVTPEKNQSNHGKNSFMIIMKIYLSLYLSAYYYYELYI